MKKKLGYSFFLLCLTIAIIMHSGCKKESNDNIDNKLPSDLEIDNIELQKYLVSTEYINKDSVGNFTSKIKVIAEYTRGFEGGYVKWNNVYIAHSNSLEQPYPAGSKQDYIENMEYIPSDSLSYAKSFFKDFPQNSDGIFAKSLIWDMMSIETFAWQYWDSLEFNTIYNAIGLNGKVELADVGYYTVTNAQIIWTGDSIVNDENCAKIEYKALNNLLDYNTVEFKSKGTEDYWGNVFVSLKDKQIEYAIMNSITKQVMQITGLSMNISTITIRELKVERMK